LTNRVFGAQKENFQKWVEWAAQKLKSYKPIGKVKQDLKNKEE
jgi:hypothetical protein